MNFKHLICLFGLAGAVALGPALATAKEKSSIDQSQLGPLDPQKICKTKGKDCYCQYYADQAVKNYCLKSPFDETTGTGNPLFDSDAQSKLSDAKGVIGGGDASTTDTCKANGSMAQTGVDVLTRMEAKCQQFINQCIQSCVGDPASLQKCSQAQMESQTITSDKSSLQSEVSRDKESKQDASNDDKKDDGSDMQMPQVNSNSCSDPTSASCQQLVQSCAVASYAATNPVCRCFGGSKDPSCGGVQTTPADDPGSDGGGGSPSYGGTDNSTSDSTDPLTSGNPQAMAAGPLLGASGGNGLQGTNGGANKADIPEYDDPKALNTAVLGGKVGGGAGAAGGASGGGGYSKDGNWIPPNLKDRTPAEAKLQLPVVSKWDIVCKGKSRPPLSNWDQMHYAAICAMKLEPK